MRTKATPKALSVSSARSPVTSPFAPRPFLVPAVSLREGVTRPWHTQHAFDSRDVAPRRRSTTGTRTQANHFVAPPNDRSEPEADRVAREMARRMGASAKQSEGAAAPSLTIKGDRPPASAEGGIPVSSSIESALRNERGNGQALPRNLRWSLEQAFDADFAGVKIHTDSAADALSRSLQARAFTTGQDVFFRWGEYSPENHSGRELLAHELTHVAQQNPRLLRAVPGRRTEVHAGQVPSNRIQCVLVRYEPRPNKEEEVETNGLSVGALYALYKNVAKDKKQKQAADDLEQELRLRLLHITDEELVTELMQGNFTKLSNFLGNSNQQPSVLEGHVLDLHRRLGAEDFQKSIGKGFFQVAYLFPGVMAKAIKALGAAKQTTEQEKSDREAVGVRVGVFRYCQRALEFCDMVRRVENARTPALTLHNAKTRSQIERRQQDAITESSSSLLKRWSHAVDFHKDWLRDRLIDLVDLMKAENVYEASDLARERNPPNAAWAEGIQSRRDAVRELMEQSKPVILRLFGGAALKYRGSLTSGWRSYPKSVDDTAQRMRLEAFDVDAFVEVPKETWATWEKARFITGRYKDTHRIQLADLQRFVAQADGYAALKQDLEVLRGEESRLQSALSEISGYKTIAGKADFFFVIQSEEKSLSQELYGNPYPPGQLASAGMKYGELLLKHAILSEESLSLPQASFLPERPVEI